MVYSVTAYIETRIAAGFRLRRPVDDPKWEPNQWLVAAADGGFAGGYGGCSGWGEEEEERDEEDFEDVHF